MQRLAETETLLIRQKKEFTEIITGFETKNKYEISDSMGRHVYSAGEVDGGFLTRNFLKSSRPWKIQILSPEGSLILELRRPFRWFFHEVNIFDATGKQLGSVKREWSWLRRIYTVYDEIGDVSCELFGPILKPWTFLIKVNGMDRGAIRKKWSGLLKEVISDADHFGIEFPPETDSTLRSVLLGAVFLIDFCHFENNNKVKRSVFSGFRI